MGDYMTQIQLAKKIGVGRTTISYWHKNRMIPEPKRVKGRPIYTENDAKEIMRIRGIKGTKVLLNQKN